MNLFPSRYRYNKLLSSPREAGIVPDSEFPKRHLVMLFSTRNKQVLQVTKGRKCRNRGRDCSCQIVGTKRSDFLEQKEVNFVQLGQSSHVPDCSGYFTSQHIIGKPSDTVKTRLRQTNNTIQ